MLRGMILAVSLAVFVLARPMMPPFGPRLERQLDEHFRAAMETVPEAAPPTEPVYRNVLTPGPVVLPRTLPRNRCPEEAYGPGADAGLYERARRRLFIAFVSVQNWLSSGQGPLSRSEFQRTVDGLGGIPCFPASPDAVPAPR